LTRSVSGERRFFIFSVFLFQGGLQEVAEQLELERIGPQHQAGSDSLLTGMAFFKMREVGPRFQTRNPFTLNLRAIRRAGLTFE